VAVDSSGSVYVTDNFLRHVLELPKGATAQHVVPFSGINGPGGLAIDSAGSLYVTDTGNSLVVKLTGG
jgi:serine/threonine protein kinase, bacterial